MESEGKGEGEEQGNEVGKVIENCELGEEGVEKGKDSRWEEVDMMMRRKKGRSVEGGSSGEGKFEVVEGNDRNRLKEEEEVGRI